MAGSFSEALGGRLRAARRRRGWSLGEVEAATDGEFKSSVVGAYERGERAISVQRSVCLAEVYGVAPIELIPISLEGGQVIDLDALATEAGGDLVERYLAAIQLMRKTASESSEIRVSDQAVLASLIEVSTRVRGDSE